MPIPTVGVLAVNENKVLLVRHEKGSGYSDHVYGLPSGRLQEGEIEIHAAVRELQEETGLETAEADLIEFPNNFYIAKLPNRKNPSEAHQEWSWRVFYCRSYRGELKPSTETTPEWVEADKLDSLYLLPNVKNAVEAGLLFVQSK